MIITAVFYVSVVMMLLGLWTGTKTTEERVATGASFVFLVGLALFVGIIIYELVTHMVWGL